MNTTIHSTERNTCSVKDQTDRAEENLIAFSNHVGQDEGKVKQAMEEIAQAYTNLSKEEEEKNDDSSSQGSD
ncbi:MAG: hypothetical protein R3B41_00910 [Candidatus Doudnabacteria bacterium]